MKVTPRLRVLHIVLDMGVGGLPRVVETLCRTTNPSIFDVRVLCLNYLGDIAERLRLDGWPVYLLPRVREGPDRFAWRRVAALYRREKVDVVHTHNTHALINGGLAAMLAPGRRIVHTDHARPFPDRFRYHLIERLLSVLAHRVVGVSEHTTANLRHYERIPRRKLLTIPNGIETALFTGSVNRVDVRQHLGIPVDSEMLLVGARLEEQKGITFLLQAVARLLPSRPRLHLAIAGVGTLRESLDAEATALGIDAHVHFLGVRLDMPVLLRVADVLVLPSNWEGLPMIVLEALAAQCPIVATAVGGVPSAVRDGDTGYLVPPQDSAQLADALFRVLTDPVERRARAARGRALFDASFSAEAMTRRYESLYLGGD